MDFSDYNLGQVLAIFVIYLALTALVTGVVVGIGTFVFKLVMGW